MNAVKEQSKERVLRVRKKDKEIGVMRIELLVGFGE